jgi:hypothetical protein
MRRVQCSVPGGIDLRGVSGTVVTNLTWDAIKQLRDGSRLCGAA